MPAYEICYIDLEGKLAHSFCVVYENDLRAKIVAHAMKPAACRQMEVWDGDRLIAGPNSSRLDVIRAGRRTPV